MKDKVRLTLKIIPEPQKRHQTVTRGKGGKPLPFPQTYDPSAKYRQSLRILATKEYSPRKPLEGPLIADIRVYRPIPKAFSKKKAQEAENGLHVPWQRPDLSNYIKAIEDSLDTIVWKDDGQVVRYGPTSGKYYSFEPRIEVDVYTWEPPEQSTV
jgi:Holliday junction resolvase RusA-like endonuclease